MSIRQFSYTGCVCMYHYMVCHRGLHTMSDSNMYDISQFPGRSHLTNKRSCRTHYRTVQIAIIARKALTRSMVTCQVRTVQATLKLTFIPIVETFISAGITFRIDCYIAKDTHPSSCRGCVDAQRATWFSTV